MNVIAEIDGWPSGIAVSSTGRVFVALPQANGQASASTVVEIVDGSAVAFPREVSRFMSVQGLRCDGDDKLFALDTGSTDLSGCSPEHAALWVVDISSGDIERRYGFDSATLFSTSYLNDLAVDADGRAAYLVDSGGMPPNALIVLDLDTGVSRRVLENHDTVRASPPVSPQAYRVEGKALVVDGKPPTVGVTAAARSYDGRIVYWAKPDTLSSAPAALLRDELVTAAELERAITRWPDRSFAADGIDQDAHGGLVLTDVTDNGVAHFDLATGRYERLAIDDRISWPDAVATGPNGSLFVTASQFHRGSWFHHGQDHRRPPFSILRLDPPRRSVSE